MEPEAPGLAGAFAVFGVVRVGDIVEMPGVVTDPEPTDDPVPTGGVVAVGPVPPMPSTGGVGAVMEGAGGGAGLVVTPPIGGARDGVAAVWAEAEPAAATRARTIKLRFMAGFLFVRRGMG